VTWEWPLYRNLARLVPWLFVLFLLILPSNRSRRAWAVLIPVALVAAPFVLFGGGSFTDGVCSLLIALAAVLLLADRLRTESGWGSLVRVVVVFALGAGLGLVCFRGLDVGAGIGMPAAMCGAAAVAVFVGLAFGAWSCRRRYSSVLFVTSVGIGVAGTWIFLMPVIAVVGAIVGAGRVEVIDLAFGLIGGGVMGFILGFGHAALAALILGFVFRNHLYRGRLEALLGLAEPVQKGTQANLPAAEG
jgi:hypothetical protein